MIPAPPREDAERRRPRALEATLRMPRDARSLVVLATSNAVERFATTCRTDAEAFARAGIATLRLELLTRDEARADRLLGHLRFDVALLSSRLVGALDWAMGDPATARLPLGCMAAGTAAAAALVAASRRARFLRALVLRGGRPDLVRTALSGVASATLLVVGGRDELVAELNRQALGHIRAYERGLHVVSGATHGFDEPGAHEEVLRAARGWFERYLADA
jgi:predicted alpha/beta-hydrolase family hydrolase